ncbi:NfeD family protein [Planctomicrobium sp. SH661]|uniref:NfeD family protein n=1 Tax=Planctomicrobium sp. SH661 TaxID=3448124 RepID=UPI003F5B693D
MLVAVLGLSRTVFAVNPPGPAVAPIARIVPVTSPIGDETLGLVRRTMLEMQDTAAREDRKGIVFLEISPGSSPFHSCYALADFLTESPFSNVTTVAWVPESVSGYNVLVALACQEIVMAPGASLGDLGNGEAVSPDQQTIIRNIVDRRRNTRVSLPLVNAMMDPSVSLVQLTIETSPGEKESRLATSTEARQLQDQGVVILDSKTISEAGTAGVLTGTQARARDVLAVRTAESRRDLIEGYGLGIDSLKELSPAEPVSKVVYIELHDVIDEVFESFAQRQIDRAVKSGAQVIVFEIDSPGGLLSVCADLSQTIAHLSEKNVKTVAYIPREAISGGAILAVACDEIYMKPDAKIGNAIPINLMGPMIVRAEEKVLSIELELLRSLAEQKHRPPAVIEGFADKDLEVFQVTQKSTGRKWYMSAEEMAQNENEWIPGPRVPESRPGIAIMVNGVRAHDLMISERPVQDIEELKQRIGVPSDMKFRTIGRTWIDTLVFNLNTPAMAGFLFFIAIVCIYIEMATMTGFFGIVSALAFAIFFWSKVMGGTADSLELALFAVGVGCLALELFVIPGFGIFGISGILLVIGSLIMASQTFTGFSLEYDMARAGKTFATFAASLIVVVIVSAILSQNLHRIPLLKDLVLTAPGTHEFSPGEPRLKPELAPDQMALMGATGEAVTILRPAGKAKFDGRLLDVVSDGPFVPEGATVTVVQVSKNRIVVRQA